MNPTENPAPVPVTRGLSQKLVSLKIDWLEGTFPKFREVAYPDDLTANYSAGRAFHGYTVCKKFADGRLEMVNPEHPAMGVHLQWSGDALEKCPVDALQLVKFQFSAGMRVTRIDLAVDAINWRLKPSRARKEIQNGNCKTRAKKFDWQSDTLAKGDTQYIGRKASTICCRIYDKARELGIPGDYTRVELILRQGRADGAVRAILSGTDFRQLVRGYVDFPQWPRWSEVMDADPVKIPREQRLGATERWLMDTCAPSLARVLDETRNPNFLRDFLTAVEVHRGASKTRESD